MTFNDDAKINSSKVSKRGRNTGIALGGGGLVVVALFLISQFTGIDLTGLVDPGQGQDQGEVVSLDKCKTGKDANEDIDCRMAGASLSIDGYWAKELPKLGVEYHSPGFELFAAATNTGCGQASSATGPFYCPSDETIYVDTSFYEELRTRFGSSGGPLAEMYVLAHEWGHHIQNIGGIMKGLNLQQTGPGSDGVRLEVQADCFAGAWVGAASTVKDEDGVPFLKPVTDAEMKDALSAASAVGDDRIQKATTGQVQPETWTHGSSEQRQKWFLTGYKGGPDACNTFDVSAGQL